MIEFVPGKISENAKFGHQVVRVPPVMSEFSHSGSLVSLPERKGYSWVERGQPIARFTLSMSKGESRSVDIRCPVSGLLLHTFYSFGHIDSESSWKTTINILLSDDQEPAETGHYMFSEMCRTCWDNRAPYLSDSTRVSMGLPVAAAHTEESLRSFLDDQLSYACTYVDAMPNYAEYFQEARTNHWNLQPHLEHLV